MKHLDQLMAPILLFAFAFASQLMAGFNIPLPPPLYGNHISILSIDGGGIKGIIPAVVLDYLDQALKAKDPTVPLAHYFDVIAGTSTGGIMTAMLTTPNSSESNFPLFTPREIVQFYKENGPHIFNSSRPGNGPKYNETFLYNITRGLLKETRLNQTLTNVVIPTFDLKQLKPVIFSKYKLETYPYINAKLSDICIGTSAAPTYFRPYKFWNEEVEFNLIDGGGTADNPALVAVSEVIQHTGHTNILLLSLGTGKQKVEEKYDADTAAKWDKLSWAGALLDIVDHSSADMILYYLATVFPGLKPADNYLRIQEYNLDVSMDSLDDVTKENMDNLEKEGNDLLEQKVKRMNVNTFIPAEIDQTNAHALDRWAEKLYQERQLRLKRKFMEKGGRPFIERVAFSRSQAT